MLSNIFNTMKKLLLYSILAISTAVSIPCAEAKKDRRDRDDRNDRREYYREDRDDRREHYRDDHRHSSRSSSKTLYFIENNRPVRRVVYVNPGGGYYHIVGGRRVVIRDRYYTSYPSRYFYPDGRRRAGITLSF